MKAGDEMNKKGITVEIAKKIRDDKGIKETKLQKLRVKKGYSQKQFAAVSGVTVRAIQGYEQRSRPIEGARLDTLCSLCFALDCKIEDILENETLIEKYKICK